jgi:hypothetical protein
MSSPLQPVYLLLAAAIVAIGIILLVLVIYGHLHFSRKEYWYQKAARQRLETWISEMIFSEPQDRPPISNEFYQMAKNPTGRSFVLNELVNARKNFTADAAENTKFLYEQLGLKTYSLKKLRSSKWHVKARGIQELYLMGQSDVLKSIYKNTNARHEFVRMEAQTGIIHMIGFEGLRFLDLVSYPLTEWQQIKLLEQLNYSKMNVTLSPAIPRWLNSPNDTVVVFALKLAEEYQQIALHDTILLCLHHPDEAVRRQAILTLVAIANEKTPLLLTEHFYKESLANRLVILDGLQKIATEQQAPFLIGLLEDENDLIKLKAAKTLALNTDGGLTLLEEKSRQTPEPYREIFLHIKSEYAL